MVGRHVSMSEVAKRLGLTLPAVSNWRRRHPSFPSPVAVDGQELFSIQEIAAWLDSRRISKNDLLPDELPGTTYGTRFRNAMNIGHVSDAATNDALWRDLSQFRAGDDIAVFADLVLGLLVLATSNDKRWDGILATDGPQRTQLVELAALNHDPPLFELHRARGALLTDFLGEYRLAEIVRLIDRARLSGRMVDKFDFLLDQFAGEEGRRDAAVHTPAAVVRLLVELAAPIPGNSVFDPCCGSGGFLVGAAKYVAALGGSGLDASFTGRALSARSVSLARMNLQLHGVPAHVDATADAVFRDNGALAAKEHFDVVLSNPPFDLKASREFSGPYGRLPRNRASFAWLQYVTSSLGENGRAAVVMPGGTLFREGAEKHVRARMVDAGVVDAIIALPPQLFSSTAVPVTVWLLRPPVWGPAGDILFIDARQFGHMISRTQRSLSEDDRSRIVDTVTNWRGGDGYEDVPGFSASVAVEHVQEQDYVLVPARYVGADIEPNTSVSTVGALRDELACLERRAAEVNTVVERRLDGIRTWIR